MRNSQVAFGGTARALRRLPPRNRIISLSKLIIVARQNLANAVSVLGVLPVCLLLGEHRDLYLLPVIIYCNVMDDLDGILAAKLNTRSEFGARLDNVCDAVSHSVILMVVGMTAGGICNAFALAATAVVILRSVSRLEPSAPAGTGSPTNELVRHVFFVLLLSERFAFDATPYLVIAFALNAITMAVPWKLPYMIRSMTKSATAIGIVNLALLIAWLIPITLPVIAATFIGTYLGSFGWAILSHWRPTSTAKPQ